MSIQAGKVIIVTMLAGPAAEPVGLAEAKNHLRISGSSEEGLVLHLIAAARSRIEEATVRAMIKRSLRVALDWWSRGAAERRWVQLPVRPAGARVTVRVFDGYGEPVMVTSRFTLPAGRQAKLMWTDGAFPWPGQRIGGSEIDYEAGFGEAPEDVADELRLAVKRLTSHAYAAAGVEASEHRVDLMVVSRMDGVTDGVRAIAAIRAALRARELGMEGRRCVLLVPAFADTLNRGRGIWRAILPMRAEAEAG